VLSQLLLFSLIELPGGMNLSDLAPVIVFLALFLRRRPLGGDVGLLYSFHRSFHRRILKRFHKSVDSNLS
jgi:hypothetical protein